MTQTNPHPEWKRLKAAIETLLPIKQKFSYAELRELAGVDIQSSRGRRQMLTFQRQALKDWGIWFECDRGNGYYVTAGDEHPGCATKRLDRGRRQTRRAERAF